MKKFIVEILDHFVWFIRFVRRFAHYCRAPLKVDIHASEHCNLKCSGCTHFSPLAKPEFCDLEQLDKSLAKLSQFEKKIGAVQLLGGGAFAEPGYLPDDGDCTQAFREDADQSVDQRNLAFVVKTSG